MNVTRTAAAARRLSVLAVAGLLLSGCAGLRAETPSPTMPSADPVEQVRQRQAVTSTEIAAAASSVAAGSTDDALIAVLDDIANAATLHVDALGGVWEPFTASPTASGDVEPQTHSTDSPVHTPTATGTDTGVEPTEPESETSAPAADVTEDVSPTQLLELLTEEASVARADASAVDDGPLARLVASIAIERSLAADQLAEVAAIDPPQNNPVSEPVQIPTGLSAAALAPAITSEDALGQAWEIVAARSSGAQRSQASALAARHRTAARDWAVAADVAGSGLDPRHAAYDLPAQILDPGVDTAERLGTLVALERELTGVWLDLSASAAPDTRATLIDAAAAAAHTAAHLTGQVPALPGTSNP